MAPARGTPAPTIPIWYTDYMLLRLLIAAIIVCLAIILVKRLRRAKKAKTRQPIPYTETIACKKCSLHIPKADAIERDGDYYCCQEHAIGTD